MGKVVEIDCEKSMKLETSRNVTKSKRSLHWCRSISKKYLCTFYYSISQKVITLSGRRFITVSGGFITLSGSYYSIGRFYYIIGQLLQYRAFITLSVGTALFDRSRSLTTGPRASKLLSWCHLIVFRYALFIISYSANIYKPFLNCRNRRVNNCIQNQVVC